MKSKGDRARLLITQILRRVESYLFQKSGLAWSHYSLRTNFAIWETGYFSATDIGPGNCLIDKWVRLNSNKIFDKNGEIARSGKINKIILDQSLDSFYYSDISQNRSYDIKDFVKWKTPPGYIKHNFSPLFLENTGPVFIVLLTFYI